MELDDFLLAARDRCKERRAGRGTDEQPEEITPKLALKALVLAMEEYEQLRSAHTLSRLIPGLVPNAAHHVTKTHF